MKMYNENTDKIEELPKTITVNNVNKIVSKLSVDELNELGFYKIKYSSKPDKNFYTSTENKELVDTTYNVGYTAIEKPIDEVKKYLKSKVSTSFSKTFDRPEVVSILGYTVDGSLADIQRLEIGKDLGVTFIKDVDGIDHDATSDDYDTVIAEIKSFGLTAFQAKWNKNVEIDALETVDKCIAYTKTEYTYQDEDGNDVIGTRDMTSYWN